MKRLTLMLLAFLISSSTAFSVPEWVKYTGTVAVTFVVTAVASAALFDEFQCELAETHNAIEVGRHIFYKKEYVDKNYKPKTSLNS
jgi:hypothetical protein